MREEIFLRTYRPDTQRDYDGDDPCSRRTDRQGFEPTDLILKGIMTVQKKILYERSFLRTYRPDTQRDYDDYEVQLFS